MDDIRLCGLSSAPETLNINLDSSFLPPFDYTPNGFRATKGKMSRSNSVRSRYVINNNNNHLYRSQTDQQIFDFLFFLQSIVSLDPYVGSQRAH